MATPLKLFIDVQGRALVASATSRASIATPVLRQGETVPVQLFFLDSTGGTTLNPFPSYASLSTPTFKLGICAGSPTGASDTLIAYSYTWSVISNGYAGDLNCNTAGILAALTGSSLACTLEIEVTEAGASPVKVIQTACTIQAAVIDDGATIPTPVSEYPTRNEVIAGFLKRITDAGDTLILVGDDGTAVELRCVAGKLDPVSIPVWP
jgi:hypothetical protein